MAVENSQGVCSVIEFLEAVWSTSPPPETQTTLFRGQSHNHPLLPRLFRPPNTPDLVRLYEGRMLDYLTRVSPHLAPSRPDNEWDWLSLGQHYGMSTRMSDWSENPLVALFFAVELDPTDQSNPIVYQYPIDFDIIHENKKEMSPILIPHTRVIKASHHSHRSEVQAAWQVVHAIHRVEDGSYQFFPLATMPPHNRKITEIYINKEHVRGIRVELSIMGMTPSTMYGDFGSVCRSIAPLFGLA